MRLISASSAGLSKPFRSPPSSNYLSNVTMGEAERVVRKCTSYIYGTQKCSIGPFPVSNRENARWIFCYKIFLYWSPIYKNGRSTGQFIAAEFNRASQNLAGRSPGQG